MFRDGAGPRGLAVGGPLLADPRVLGHGLGNGVVEASVEGVKLVGSDRRIELFGQLRDGLGARGHEQIVVADGVRALDVVLHAEPELVIVGDPLADMSATQFCRQVRASPEGANAVILVLTARDDQLSAVLDAGATDLYTTSLGPVALETRVLIAERLVAEHARLRDRESRIRADTSVRKRGEVLLRASEAQYGAFFERSPFPKFLYDPRTLRFLAANEAAVAHYGYSRAEFLRMTLDDIQVRDVRAFPPHGGSRDVRTTGLCGHRTKDGSIIDVDVTVRSCALGSEPCDLAVALDRAAGCPAPRDEGALHVRIHR